MTDIFKDMRPEMHQNFADRHATLFQRMCSKCSLSLVKESEDETQRSMFQRRGKTSAHCIGSVIWMAIGLLVGLAIDEWLLSPLFSAGERHEIWKSGHGVVPVIFAAVGCWVFLALWDPHLAYPPHWVAARPDLMAWAFSLLCTLTFTFFALLGIKQLVTDTIPKLWNASAVTQKAEVDPESATR